MKKLIKISLVLISLTSQIAPAFAGGKDYKPLHGGYPGAIPARRAPNLSDLPKELQYEIAKFLSPSSFGAFASSCRNVAPLGRDPIVGFQVSKNGTPVYDLQGNRGYTEQRVSQGFADLGKMHKIAGLIWSGVAPRNMNQSEAVAYCTGLGGGSRLPTKDEYIALSRAMGSKQPFYHAPGFDVAGYDGNLIPDMDRKIFWSVAVHPLAADFGCVFGSGVGIVGYDYSYSDTEFSVRCVVDG